jgi:hypothetical protein
MRLEHSRSVPDEDKVHKFINSVYNTELLQVLQKFLMVDREGSASYDEIKQRAIRVAPLYSTAVIRRTPKQVSPINEVDEQSVMPILTHPSTGEKLNLSEQLFRELKRLSQQSHSQVRNTNQPRRQQSESKSQCNYCGHNGHLIRECRTRQADQKYKTDRRRCYKCGAQAQHTAFDCPQVQQRPVNSQTALPQSTSQRSTSSVQKVTSEQSRQVNVIQTQPNAVHHDSPSQKASEEVTFTPQQQTEPSFKVLSSISGGQLPMTVKASIGNQSVSCLIDTGAVISCLDSSVFNSMNDKWKSTVDDSTTTRNSIRIRTASGETLQPLGKVILPVESFLLTPNTVFLSGLSLS